MESIMNRGMVFALLCYLSWGFLPIYWKALAGVPGLETTAHRVVWSAAVAVLILALRKRWAWVRTLVHQPRVLWTFAGTAALIFANWYIYIYAINTNHIVESSLGYFINPLVNVLLGIIFLGERPRPWQWVAIGTAAVGVTYLTFEVGRLPYIALGLAFSFAFYALLKKTATIPAVEGLLLEMFYLTIPLGAYLIWLEVQGTAAFGHTDLTTSALLAFSGVVTAIPLALFAAGARHVPMTVLGILQYVAPTIQFIIGILLYHEPFSYSQLIGFAFIWTALIIFTLETTAERRRWQLAMRAR
jgi:chloramphenicol-sensitive protein RarD